VGKNKNRRDGHRRGPSLGARGAALGPVGGALFRGGQPQWDKFQRAHGAWWSRLDAGRPVYCLPEEVVERLSLRTASEGQPVYWSSEEVKGRLPSRTPSADLAGPRLYRVITEEEAEAERAFCHCCQSFSPLTVGVWRDQLIRYEPLGSSPPSLSAQFAAEWGWDPFINRTALPSALDAANR
jgi:hypothetical protein